MVLMLMILGLVLRRRMRSLGTLLPLPMLTGFFCVDFVLALVVGATCPMPALATATSPFSPAHHPYIGKCAVTSVVLPITRAVACPAVPWISVASGAGALGVSSHELEAAGRLFLAPCLHPLKEPATPLRPCGGENQLAAAVITTRHR